MTSTSHKDRTSITIDNNLYDKAKNYCKRKSLALEKKLSFSELVTIALTEYFEKEEGPTGVSSSYDITNGYSDNVTL